MLALLSGLLATYSGPGSPPEGRELLIHNSSVVSPGTGFLGQGHMSTCTQVAETREMKSVDWLDLGYMLTF